MFLEGSAQIITILQRGGYRNLLQYHMGGGLPDLLQYYKGGGSLGTPNLYYVIYGRPLNLTDARASRKCTEGFTLSLPYNSLSFAGLNLSVFP